MLRLYHDDCYEPLSALGRVARARGSEGFDDRFEQALIHGSINVSFAPLNDRRPGSCPNAFFSMLCQIPRVDHSSGDCDFFGFVVYILDGFLVSLLSFLGNVY